MGQAAVRAALVVMLDVPAQNANKLLATYDQQLIKTLSADGTDPPFSDRIGVGRLHQCADDPGAGRAHTSLNALVNLASRSRIRNSNAVA